MSKDKRPFVEDQFGLGKPIPDRPETEFPQGDGRPDCPDCRGRGVVSIPLEERGPWAVGDVTQPCRCTHLRDLAANINRGWKGLLRDTKPIAKTPLTGYVRKDCWITADLGQFRSHMLRLAFEQGRHWNFKVITDVDLLSAWLFSANEVQDPDVELDRQTRQLKESRSSRIEDLVEPWSLLIIRLGVKVARNVAAPEVLLEALQLREQLSRPTWIVDEPHYPFAEGHISFDMRAGEHVETWSHIGLSELAPVGQQRMRPMVGMIEATMDEIPIQGSTVRVRREVEDDDEGVSNLVGQFGIPDSAPDKGKWKGRKR